MKKIISFCLGFIIFAMSPAYAVLSLELTQGVAGATPIVVVPLAGRTIPQNLAQIIANDLQNSGRFKVYDQNALKQFPSHAQEVSRHYFQHLGANNLVVGKVLALGDDRYQINFQLLDPNGTNQLPQILLKQSYEVSSNHLRAAAHHISDLIYQSITGSKGVFSTKLAYVVIQRLAPGKARYILEIADQDGYNPRPLLNSPEPIMSPAWSPNGKQIAYVSFENRRAGIYLQDLSTGARRLLSNFPGINGAPAWSPDGRRLALVLSKGGAPNIYVMELATQRLHQITKDFYINTEPSWSRDGRHILFTSNRGGPHPQIYQINLANNIITRISYEGDYNARASYAPDGRHIVMIHRVSGVYHIAILDLDAGTLKILNNRTADSASPSLAPNGSMVLYDTFAHGVNVLAMASTDSNIQLLLPARNGEAQDPAWSPFLP